MRGGGLERRWRGGPLTGAGPSSEPGGWRSRVAPWGTRRPRPPSHEVRGRGLARHARLLRSRLGEPVLSVLRVLMDQVPGGFKFIHTQGFAHRPANPNMLPAANRVGDDVAAARDQREGRLRNPHDSRG